MEHLYFITLQEGGALPATAGQALDDMAISFRLLRHTTLAQAILRVSVALPEGPGVAAITPTQAQALYDAGGYEEVAGGVV